MLYHRVLEYLLLSLFIAPFSLRYARMDRPGSLAAFFIGFVVYVSLGPSGFAVLLLLHVLGAAATRAGYERKVSLRVAQERRGAANVAANGLFPAFAAALAWSLNHLSSLFYAAYVSTVAAATADTLSSEIGELSPGRPRLITTFEEVEVGTNGAVSALGTAAGLVGAGIIAFVGAVLKGSSFSATVFSIALLAGAAGFMLDSILGATLERKKVIGNSSVNLLSTGMAFLISLLLYSQFR